MSTSTSRLLLAVALTALAVTGCGSTDGDDDGSGGAVPAQTLTIVAEDWNGWDPAHVPTPETTTLEVAVGASATVDGLGEQVTFEVVEVADGEVTVSSDSELAPEGETGGSNLNDLVDEFTVATGAGTELDTPTMDAGYSYTLTLEPTTR